MVLGSVRSTWQNYNDPLVRSIHWGEFIRYLLCILSIHSSVVHIVSSFLTCWMYFMLQRACLLIVQMISITKNMCINWSFQRKGVIFFILQRFKFNVTLFVCITAAITGFYWAKTSCYKIFKYEFCFKPSLSPFDNVIKSYNAWQYLGYDSLIMNLTYPPLTWKKIINNVG